MDEEKIAYGYLDGRTRDREAKVLELQRTKRDLADAIINADNSLIRSLKREDLELLLG